MPSVTMDLTDEDVKNYDRIQSLCGTPSKAQAVSIAGSLTRFLVDAIHAGDEIVLRKKDGSTVLVTMIELAQVSRA